MISCKKTTNIVTKAKDIICKNGMLVDDKTGESFIDFVSRIYGDSLLDITVSVKVDEGLDEE